MIKNSINTNGVPLLEGMEIIEIETGPIGVKTIVSFSKHNLSYTLHDDGKCISFKDQFGVIRRGCFSDDGVEIYDKLISLKDEDIRNRNETTN